MLPEKLDAHTLAATPLGLENFSSPTQGSSCLATLGWRMQSRWDWKPRRFVLRHSFVIRHLRFVISL